MTIKPVNYNLLLAPDFEKFTFYGKEILTFETVTNCQEIKLDCADISIKKCSLIDKKKEYVVSFKIDKQNELLFIKLQSELSVGKYQLLIEYEGVLNDQLRGFYRSKYFYKGKKEYLLTTQFEPTDAHRAFPCIDHPSFKATFDISFVIPDEYTGISNMPQIEEKNISKTKKIIRFNTTPKMSTYLLYFGIGKWEIIERRTKSNILIRGITTSGKSKYAKFALEVAEKCLDYFSDYFDYPYNLPKLDLLAIPDFASGAMENWGAITFREILLLYYPGKTSRAIKERIAEVICHEIAHQWFGNLVTMKWFDDLWLNESFATYMAFKALSYIFPSWENWHNYLKDIVFEGMFLDSLSSTHPIHVKNITAKETDEIFDEISYNKGGSILRMIEGYLGEEKFQKAIRLYIKMFEYQNATAKDLWKRFEELSEELTCKMIEKFVIQPGFPLIKFSLNDDFITLNQERFLFLGVDKNKLSWDVPVVIFFDNLDKRIILDIRQLKIKKPVGRLIALNKDYTGFYISQPDKAINTELGKNFSFNNSLGKVGVIHDLYYLVLADRQSLDDFLDFIENHLHEEKDPYVLHYVIAKLLSIYKLTGNIKAKNLLADFSHLVIKLTGLKPKVNEKLSSSMARNAAIAGLIFLKDKKMMDFVNDLFQSSLKKESVLHKDLKGVIYASAVWIDKRNYHIVLKLYEEKQIQEEKVKLLSALGNSQDEKQIQETLNYILTDKVRLSDYFYPIASISGNPKAKKVAIDWLINDWEKILKKLGLAAKIYIRRTLKFIVPECAIGREKEITDFLKTHQIEGLEKTYAQVIEELKVYSRFVRKYKKP